MFRGARVVKLRMRCFERPVTQLTLHAIHKVLGKDRMRFAQTPQP